MPFTPKLTYKGKPLVRKDNELYYGRMTDPYVLRMQILSTKSVGGMDVADKVHIQVFSTNDSLAPEARVFRQMLPMSSALYRPFLVVWRNTRASGARLSLVEKT